MDRVWVDFKIIFLGRIYSRVELLTFKALVIHVLLRAFFRTDY